ncbi:MAG: protein O-mannosyl-transferase family, partial [Anaerolineales bacterium]
WAGLCAALALGFSTTFWAQATTANIRMPTALALAFALERVLAYRRTRSNRALRLVALALGLGVAHHGSLVFVAAVLGLYVLWLNPSVLRKPWPLLMGLLPFLAWLYFPLRAGAFGAPPSIATLSGFLEHVLALGFRGDIFYFANLADLPERLRIFGNILTFQFAWPLLALAVLGLILAVWRDRPLGGVLLAAFLAHTFVAITYRAPQTVEYLLPSYVLMAVWIGIAFAELFTWFGLLTAEHSESAEKKFPASSKISALSANAAVKILPALLIALFSLGAQLLSTFPSYRALAQDKSTRDYAESVLDAAPPNAIILASWHRATPLWYLQHVEGQRSDVAVRYVFPRGESLAQNWTDAIVANLPARPVVVTSFYPQEYGALPYRFLPLGPAWEVRAGPLLAPPANLTGAQAFGNWEFLGYHLEASSAPSAISTVAVLTAAWRTPGPPHDINFFIHLIGADGQLYGQADVSYPAGRYTSGEVLLDRYPITPRPDAPPGEYQLVAGAYTPDGARLAQALLTTLSMTHSQLPFTPPPQSIPLGSSIYLLGSRLSPTGRLHPGEALTVDLRFLAARPITDDYTVKVDLIGPGWRWHIQSDTTPAGGALPSLKWIAGSRVTDRHRFTIPFEAAPGTAQIVMAVYDSFTQQNLPILDPRLAAFGPNVPLGTVEIVLP